MIAQIAEGGGKAAAFVEGMFVDAEFKTALQSDAFASLAMGVLPINALNGGAAQTPKAEAMDQYDRLLSKTFEAKDLSLVSALAV